MNTVQKNVKYFFEKDYPRLKLMVGDKTTPINLTDKDELTYYQNIYNIIWLTIPKLKNTAIHPYKTIIEEHFINGKSIKTIEPLIEYKTHASYYKFHEALTNFAEVFTKQQKENKVFPLVNFSKR